MTLITSKANLFGFPFYPLSNSKSCNFRLICPNIFSIGLNLNNICILIIKFYSGVFDGVKSILTYSSCAIFIIKLDL